MFFQKLQRNVSQHLDKYPLLFQPYPVDRLTTGGKKTRKSDPVTVIWDDGEMMTMTFQGTQRAYPSKQNPLMVLDEDKLPQTAVIEELNRVENEELRRGYYLGIINQRGVHWIDPEGKPELELAEDYENRANIAESRGYSRYAGILRVIGDEFKREAKSNILEAKNGDDE